MAHQQMALTGYQPPDLSYNHLSSSQTYGGQNPYPAHQAGFGGY